MPRHKMDLKAAVAHLANLKRPEQTLRKMGNTRVRELPRSSSCPVALYLHKLTGNDSITVTLTDATQWDSKPWQQVALPSQISELINKFDSEVF